jgi:hypothetical protein
MAKIPDDPNFIPDPNFETSYYERRYPGSGFRGLAKIEDALVDAPGSNILVTAVGSTNPRSLGVRAGASLSALDFIPQNLHSAIADRTSTADLSSYLQAAINAAAGKTLDLPAGKLCFASTLVFANNVTYRGAGKTGNGLGGTFLWYTGASDAIQINNAINSFTRADIVIRDMGIFSQGYTAGKGTLVDTGSSYLTLDNISFGNNWYGLVLDQTEHFIARGCDFNSGWGLANVWVVNGPDRNGAAIEGYTNQLAFHDCSFGGVATYGVADDGGISHSFKGCEFTGANTHSYRIAGCENLIIEGTEDEGSVGGAVKFASTRLNGAASYMPTFTAALRSNFFLGVGANYTVDANPGAIVYLKLDHNTFAVAPGGSKPINIANFPVIQAVGNVSYVAASGIMLGTNNYSPYTADYIAYNNHGADSGIQNAGGALSYFGTSNTQPWNPVVTAAGGGFVLGNGTARAHWSRTGNLVTASFLLTIGSTTAIGTGVWTANLPVTEALSMPWFGSAYFLHGANVYRGVARVSPGAASVGFWGTDGAAVAVGAAVPFAWAVGDQLGFTITYNVPAK